MNRVRSVGRFVIITYYLGLLTWGLAASYWWAYLVAGAWLSIFLSVVVKENDKDEHWTTAEDSGNPGPYPGGTHPVPRTSLTGVASGPIYTGTLPRNPSAITGTISTTVTTTTTGTTGPGLISNGPLHSAAYMAAVKAIHGVTNGPAEAEEPLQIEHQDEPIKAYKIARVEFLGDGKLMFHAITGAEYGVEDVAKCSGGYMGDLPHNTPHIGCSCGFYAMKDPKAIFLDYKGVEVDAAAALLEVELYGTVIVCKNGYRAEKQRVLSVTMLGSRIPKCQWRGTVTRPDGSAHPGVCHNDAVYQDPTDRQWCMKHLEIVKERTLPQGPFETEVKWVQS